jgi:hypothetical protein
VGNSSFLANTTGSENVALGFQSGLANTTGILNVYIGSNATGGATNNANVVIGSNTNGGGSSTIVGYNAQDTNGGSVVLGRAAASTAPSQFVVGSAGIPAGAITTEVVVSDTTWSVRINGTAYKILLKA